MDFLPLQNMICAGDKLEDSLSAKDKHVVVIGGGILVLIVLGLLTDREQNQ